ncbi:ORC1-type DNA replication protein [Candidatus Woesearchaeota archaeon]|nr:ORC1-type DNA replication protein [Candidatus Woesearchaeota archaeon]
MIEKGITGLFEDFLNKESLFQEKKVLQSSYTPSAIVHRDNEIKQLANILAPALRVDRPSNVFLYGKTGTGKTLTARYTTAKILQVAEQRNIPITILYLNCKLNKIADTEYRLIAQLSRDLGKEIPATGLPTEEIYKVFYTILESKKQIVIIILDEIDQLVKKAGDGIIYNLTRVNSELKNSQISIIGISNDLLFTDHIDPRVKSSLSEEEIIFPPYNAIQLQDILHKRSKLAFKESVIGEGVIEKCSAYAAREHGDARRALELLRVAGELAERAGKEKIELTDIDEAEEKIERDRVLDIVKTQPKQQQAALLAIVYIAAKRIGAIFTGDVYALYAEICEKIALRPLTQRRLSDIISELDMLGIINAKVISKGRFGRTRDITLAIPLTVLPKIRSVLEQSLDL